MKTKAKTSTDQKVVQLFKEFSPELKRYANRICSNATHAEDCVQLSFVKLWKKKDTYSFDNIEKIKSWLRTVIKNSIYTYFERNKRYNFTDPLVLENEFEDKKVVVNDTGLSILIESEETEKNKQKLTTCINKLSKKQKQVIELRFFQNMSYEQIAKKTKNKVTNVGFLINEAKNNLKKHLANQERI